MDLFLVEVVGMGVSQKEWVPFNCINFTKRFISTYHNLLCLAMLGYSCEHTENRSTASNDKAKALSDIKPAKKSDSEILINHSDPLKII